MTVIEACKQRIAHRGLPLVLLKATMIASSLLRAGCAMPSGPNLFCWAIPKPSGIRLQPSGYLLLALQFATRIPTVKQLDMPSSAPLIDPPSTKKRRAVWSVSLCILVV